MPARVMRDRFKHPAWLLLLAPIVWICLWRKLGDLPIQWTDETVHTDVARNFLLRHDWLYTWYWEGRYGGKPPLRMWVTAIVFQLLGRDLWLLRMPDAAAASITTLLVWAIARRHLSGPAIVAAPLIFLTAPLPLAHHGWREGVTESFLTMFITAGVLLFLRSEQSPRSLYGVGVALGGASLVKSVVAFLPWAPVGAYLLLRREWRRLFSRPLFAAVVVSALPYLWWYGRIPGYLHGEVEHNWGRRFVYFQKHSHPMIDYWIWIQSGFHPWERLLIPAAIAVALAAAYGSAFDLWLLLWGGGLIVPFLLADAKHPWYVYPAYPAIAMALARLVLPPELWREGIAQRGIRRAARIALTIAGACVVLVLLRGAVWNAWRMPRAFKPMPFDTAVRAYRTLPQEKRNLVVSMTPQKVCPDERYYIDLMEARTGYVNGLPDVVAAIARTPDIAVILPYEDLPALYQILVQHGLLAGRELRLTDFWARCKRTRWAHEPIPQRAFLMIGDKPPGPPFAEPPPFVPLAGFDDVELTPRGIEGHIEGRGAIWFPHGGCARLRAHLGAERPAQAILDLPGWREPIALGREGLEVDVTIDVPTGGAMGVIDTGGEAIAVERMQLQTIP